ncbi:MAG TPA: DoxX family protein [Puia sp.]|nr:DoxX family protein [Puia sp.]
MKTIKIAYWIFTILLVVLMLFSAVASLRQNPDGVAMMKHIEYPYSVLTLLSIAKILGVIAILVPGFPRLKEWAYAGFTFDLVGAIYASLAVGDPVSQSLPIVLGLVFVFGSYIFYHKKMKGIKMS